ncbi:MAG: LCP family protein, partial [Solirubrobacteraceae bacterium]
MSEAGTTPRPPRPGLGFAVRVLLVGMLVLTATGSAVAATLWNEGKGWEDVFKGKGPTVSRETLDALTGVEADGAQTVLLVGDDRRSYGGEADDKGSATRSDTMIQLRLDPDAKATTMLSLPRDLVVDHDGGRRGKLNEAYVGGPA